MKICHLGKFYPPATGGVETHVQALARAQRELGAEVRVLCVNHRAAGRDVTWKGIATTPTQREDDGGVEVVRLGRYASLSRFDVCPNLPAELLRARRERFDVLHLHSPNPTMFAALACLPRFATLVVTHHGDPVRQRALRAIYAPFEHAMFRRAALAFASSDSYAEGSAVLRRFREKVRTLPLGIVLSPFQNPSKKALEKANELRAKYGDAPLWLSVGRVVYYKGLENAVDALTHVPGRLLVVGRGPSEDELRTRARARGVEGRVVWAGYLDEDELVGAYRAATALWFPSNARSEGYGLTQVEALASGLPIVNTHVPGSGVSWVSRDGETGFTVPMNDPEALARAANRLADDPELRARFAAAGRTRAERDFDHRLMARRCLALYEEALGRATSRTSPERSANGCERDERTSVECAPP